MDELESDGFTICYSKIRGKRKLSRILGCIKEQIKLYWDIEKDSDVWLYNVTVLNILLILLLWVFKPSVRIYSILADFTPTSRINKLLLPVINRLNGIISLSNSDLFTIDNKVILPGIAPREYNHPNVELPIKRNFLLSGALRNEICSLPLVLESFAASPNCMLNITGHEADEVLIKEYTKVHPNIHYFGEISYEGFKEMLISNPFVLSTRDPSYPENMCNFPSKIIEALLYNRIIVSTIHYIQLDNVKYIEVSSTKDEFVKMLSAISDMSDQELLSFANQSSKVIDMFSTDVWAKKIKDIEDSRV